jgi:hypothetical protein
MAVALEVYAPNSLMSMKIVGGGDVTDRFCGSWLSVKGCLRVKEHERIGKLLGKDFKDVIFEQKVHHWCNSWDCPLCYRHGTAVREARKIEGRLAEASKLYGNVEHFIISLDSRFYGLSVDAMFKMVEKGLAVRGIVGAVLIPHSFGKRHFEMIRSGVFRQIGDVFRFHVHALGYLSGGYDLCRNCRINGVVPSKERCCKCGGFEFVTRKCNESDGLIVKVAEDKVSGLPSERESVYGTAWYQLHHASVKVGRVGVKSRSHVVRWYGVVSYRKLHVKVVVKKQVCPICKLSLYGIRYGGVRDFCVDLTSSRYVSHSLEHLHEDGVQVWFISDSVGGKPKGYGYYDSED